MKISTMFEVHTTIN